MGDYDKIYLQVEPDYVDGFDSPTWCQDRINGTDVKYLKATPRRAAADAMYEALRACLLYHETGVQIQIDDYNRAKKALALADEVSDE